MASPKYDLSGSLTGSPVALGDTSGAAAPGLSMLAGVADQFAQRMRGMQMKAAGREGQAQAAKDAEAGTLAPHNPDTAFGAGYNDVAKQAKGAQYKAALSVDLDKALADNPDDPDAYGQAARAAVAGYGSTGFVDLDQDLKNYAVLQVAAGRSQAVQGQTRRKMEMAHGAFLTTLQAEEQLIGHVTATAAFDPDGSALVAAQLDRTLTNLAKFGPRQAFDAGGLHFDADPARLGVLGADDLVKTAQDLGASARGQWVQHAADALPDAKAKQAFADDLVKRYKDNDPLLAGFDGEQFEQLQATVQGIANKAESREHAAQAEAARNAGNAIQALEWGQNVDVDKMLSDAQASGDIGLMAQAKVYARIGPQVPAILRRRARQVADGEGDGWEMPADLAPGSKGFVAWQNTKAGMSSDPINFARGSKRRAALADVAPLVPDAAFDGGQAGQYWGAAMQQRMQLGSAMAQRYAVPLRMLTNGEKAYYADRIDHDPAYGVRLAQAARQAIGNDGAQALMKEIGGDGANPVSVHLADLASRGSTRLVSSAIEGGQLRAQGAKEPKFGPDGDPLDGLQAEYATAFKASPQALVAGRTVAENARLADRSKGIFHPDAYYLNGALGAQSSNGRVYGGVGTVNGRATAMPSWLDRTQGEAALKALGERWQKFNNGPAFTDGTPMKPHEVAKLQLVMTKTGRYGLVNPKTGNAVFNKAGTPVVFDMDAVRPYLKGVLHDGVQ
jgi:hypothetical protein